MHAIWKFAFRWLMQPELVTDMGKVGCLRLRRSCNFYRFGKGVVRDMLLVSQGVEHKHFAALYLFEFFSIDVVGICDIGKVANPESEYLHFVVGDFNRKKLKVADAEGVIFCDRMQPDLRNAWIVSVLKNVCILTTQGHLGLFGGIHIHRLLLKEIISPHVIEPSNMVLMAMGEDNSIELMHPAPQHLITKIRTRIDHYMCIF